MPPTRTTTARPTACPRLAGVLTAWGCLAAAAVASAPGLVPSAAAAPVPASTSVAAPASASPPAALAVAAPAPADTTEADYTQADVDFMRGMIHHHAQAVVMARMAPDRAESPAVRRLTARILNSQKTEIDLMADWLRDRGEPVPEIAARVEASSGDDGAGEGRARDPSADDAADGDETGDAAAGDERSGVTPPGGWDEGPQMPGVLSDEKMRRLRAARGKEFDRLFLTWMIEHHEGAVTMVENLVDSPGAAREESVFRLASGIRSDQETEIDRMRSMLKETLFGDGGPR